MACAFKGILRIPFQAQIKEVVHSAKHIDFPDYTKCADNHIKVKIAIRVK
jgi:hypothetical protein